MQTRQFAHPGDAQRAADSTHRSASASDAWIAVEGASGWRFVLERGVTRVGRSDPRSSHQPDVALDDDAISRRHLEIRRAGEGFVVVDVGSTNGTWLNGQELAPHHGHPLQPGDRIVLGCETELLFGVGAGAGGTTLGPAPGPGPASNLARELATARIEIRALQEELARERRLSEVDGSPLGQRTLGEIARELDEARQQLGTTDPHPSGAEIQAATPEATVATLREQLATLNAEIERRQGDLDRLSERHACLERHWGERLRQLDHLLAAEQSPADDPAIAA